MIGRLGNGHRRWPHCRRWCIHQGVKVDDTQSPYTTPICLTLPVLSCWPHPCTSHTNRFTMCIVNIHALLMVRDRLHRWALFCFACECCRWRDMRVGWSTYKDIWAKMHSTDRMETGWKGRIWFLCDGVTFWAMSLRNPHNWDILILKRSASYFTDWWLSKFCSLLGSWDPTKSFTEDMKRPFFLAFCSKQ